MKANAVELVKSLGNTFAEWRLVRGASAVYVSHRGRLGCRS